MTEASGLVDNLEGTTLASGARTGGEGREFRAASFRLSANRDAIVGAVAQRDREGSAAVALGRVRAGRLVGSPALGELRNAERT
jgi:hypothetical protein